MFHTKFIIIFAKIEIMKRNQWKISALAKYGLVKTLESFYGVQPRSSLQNSPDDVPCFSVL